MALGLVSVEAYWLALTICICRTIEECLRETWIYICVVKERRSIAHRSPFDLFESIKIERESL